MRSAPAAWPRRPPTICRQTLTITADSATATSGSVVAAARRMPVRRRFSATVAARATSSRPRDRQRTTAAAPYQSDRALRHDRGTAFNGVNVTWPTTPQPARETAAYSTSTSTLRFTRMLASTTAQVSMPINANWSVQRQPITMAQRTSKRRQLRASRRAAPLATSSTSRRSPRHLVQQRLGRHHQECRDGARNRFLQRRTNTLTIHSNVNSKTSQLISAVNTEGTFSARRRVRAWESMRPVRSPM